MDYIDIPTLAQAAKEKHNSDIVCSGDPFVYANIQWNSTVIDEATLIISQLELAKDRVKAQIRSEAAEERFNSTKDVLNTSDPEQLRTYDEKYEEASAYLIFDQTPTPIMDAEVIHTGESVAVLAPQVVSQYDTAKFILKSMYGNIEGIRRKNIALVDAMTTIEEVRSYGGPSW